ncbi:40S ribosomal protein S30 [Microbotryomycetes sp. JL221]|nr:40S ribosomal protein S30 [Microbotryomycetes sp. JL221]
MATVAVSSTSAVDNDVCPNCQAPLAHWRHEDHAQGIDVCAKCGEVLPDSSSTQLQVLGRVLEDEDREFGRRYLGSGGFTYAGDHLGQDARSMYHHKKKKQAHEQIRFILNRHNMAGLFDRVLALLEMSRRHTNVTWGPRTTMLSTACIYIASRENDRHVRLASLAEDADINETSLARTVQQLKTWLKIKTRDDEPIMYLEFPIVHLTRLFSESDSTSTRTNVESDHRDWSDANVEFVKKLDMTRVRRVATDLLAICTDVQLTGWRRPEGLAVAAVLVAMEGVAHQLLPLAVEFMERLGSIFGMKSFTIGERYRELMNVVLEFSKQLPWIKLDEKASKVTIKRVLVNYIEDIVKFRKSLKDDERRQALSASQRQGSRDSAFETKSDDDDEGADVDAEADADGAVPMFERDPLKDSDAATALMALGRNITAAKGKEKDASGAANYEPDSNDRNPDGSIASSNKTKKSKPVQAKRARIESTPDPADEGNSPSLADANAEQDEPFNRPSKRKKKDYIRDRPGLTKKRNTIEAVIQSLASSLTGRDTILPFIVASTDHVATTGSKSKSRKDAKNGEASLMSDSASVSAPHADSTFLIRRQLLAGGDFSMILQNRKSMLSEQESQSRLSQLLWSKAPDDIDDDELFDDGELDNLLRDDREVSKLKRLPKYIEMIKIDQKLTEEAEQRRLKREAETKAGIIRHDKLRTRKRPLLAPSEIQKAYLREEAMRQGVPVPDEYRAKTDKRRLSTTNGLVRDSSVAPGQRLGVSQNRSRVTSELRAMANNVLGSLGDGEGETEDFTLALGYGSPASDQEEEGDDDATSNDSVDDDESNLRKRGAGVAEGKVHGSLARAGKVKSQTPKVEPQEKKKKVTGRAKKRMIYNRRFVNVTTAIGGKKKGLNTQPEGKSG